MVKIKQCPDWPLYASLGAGANEWQRMLNAVAEVFSPSEGEPPTHLHIYYQGRGMEAALKADAIKKYPTLTTYSVE